MAEYIRYIHSRKKNIHSFTIENINYIFTIENIYSLHWEYWECISIGLNSSQVQILRVDTFVVLLLLLN